MNQDLFGKNDGAPDPGSRRQQDLRAIDELLQHTRQYRSGQDYLALLEFIRRFRMYSPFNAMLIHTQKPGSRFVATARRWHEKWSRTIRFCARPIVVLQPMGPVLFVFDVSDTEPLAHAPPLPPAVEQPFEVHKGVVGEEFARLAGNARRDGIRVIAVDHGSESAGRIQVRNGPRVYQDVYQKLGKNRLPIFMQVPVRYEVAINQNHSPAAQLVTLAHELAHLYCGHLGTPNPKWWPNRTGLTHASREFEAESTAYLVCGRLGIDNPSEEYLAGYVQSGEDIPPISLDNVMRAAGLIESMARHRHLKPRGNDDQ